MDEPGGDVIAVRSDPGFELKADSLERRQSGIELLSVAVENGVMVAKVFVPTGKLVHLLAVLDSYERHETRTGRPKNQELVESIASIRLATVRDFWQDTAPFPNADQRIWWEAWLRTSGEDAAAAHERFASIARENGLVASTEFVAFPERVVTLVFGNREQIGGSLDLMFRLAELRKAKELATDYRALRTHDQQDVIREFLQRVTPPPADAPAVCILDTGVNRAHPLLAPALAEADTLSVKPEWGTADDARQHGTEMAGVALYGDLAEALVQPGAVALKHRLESVKLLPPAPGANEPKDYGPFTSQAISRAELANPERNRVICMAVTADDRDLGTPSLWSGYVDQIIAARGEERGNRRLMFISAGNARDEIYGPAYVYHQTSCLTGVEDPGQSWNAVTVGAYTRMWEIRDGDYAGWAPVAEPDDLSPTSRTSHPWIVEDRCEWPFKPDIVMEGGNYATDGTNRDGIDDLSLLTTMLSPVQTGLFSTTRDTSPATALAARMAALIWARYPDLWPESVRGLMVHSADWTNAMRDRFPGDQRAQVKRLLRCYGYGVPNLARALSSAENVVTLLYEGELQPYHRVDGSVKTKEMHLHELPWPVQVLQDLGATPVTMRVTLSYFVEPSPGRIGWTTKHRYQSHGLRFDVIRPEDSVEEFKQRLTRDEWDDRTQRPPPQGGAAQAWIIGDRTRVVGSLHSDWWTGTAAQLAACRHIAVYPVTGWWRERAHLGEFTKLARYSLIVTLGTPDTSVDLYTPITTAATVSTEIANP